MSVTVVIPVYGRSVLTRHCLDTLLAQDLPAGTQILVVDDASPDDTADVLEQYAGRVRVLRNFENSGFAVSCNRGVAAAETELVVLLNNDTTPHPGWLHALVGHAQDHPEAGAVGARLLHLDGTVQHAGVVFGRDRLPHHVYAGFPGDHPAVVRSRRFQVVTGACLLLRRGLFLSLDGFDTGYRNGHEDVDLCLRLGAAGAEVHYCGEAVLTHLESVSRGRRSRDEVANGRRWCRRWQASVRPDDLEVYAEDGLLSVQYDGDATPLVAQVSPLLATLERRARAQEVEQLLRQRTRQVHELLQDAVRLSVLAAGADPAVLVARPRSTAGAVSPLALLGTLADTHSVVRERDDEVQDALAALQSALAARLDDAYAPNPGPAYRALVARVRRLVATAVPADATVLVVTRGDPDLLALGSRRAWHFPRDPGGGYAGFHPVDGAAVLAHLAELQTEGATHLVLPATALWWLDHYPDFAAALAASAPLLVAEPRDCLVYALSGQVAP